MWNIYASVITIIRVEKIKYAKAYVSETFVTAYFEYLVITLSMSQSVSQSMSYSMNKKIQRDEAKYHKMWAYIIPWLHTLNFLPQANRNFSFCRRAHWHAFFWPMCAVVVRTRRTFPRSRPFLAENVVVGARFAACPTALPPATATCHMTFCYLTSTLTTMTPEKMMALVDVFLL